jgi:hypothetical protein
MHIQRQQILETAEASEQFRTRLYVVAPDRRREATTSRSPARKCIPGLDRSYLCQVSLHLISHLNCVYTLQQHLIGMDSSASSLSERRSPMKKSWRDYMTEEVTREWTDLILLVGCFATGLLDAAVFNVWQCFVSMQTGNSFSLDDSLTNDQWVGFVIVKRAAFS